GTSHPDASVHTPTFLQGEIERPRAVQEMDETIFCILIQVDEPTNKEFYGQTLNRSIETCTGGDPNPAAQGEVDRLPYSAYDRIGPVPRVLQGKRGAAFQSPKTVVSGRVRCAGGIGLRPVS